MYNVLIRLIICLLSSTVQCDLIESIMQSSLQISSQNLDVKCSELLFLTGLLSKPGVPGLLLEKASPRGKGDLLTLATDSKSKYDFSPFRLYSDTLMGGGRDGLPPLPGSAVL